MTPNIGGGFLTGWQPPRDIRDKGRKIFAVESGELLATIPFRTAAVSEDPDVAASASFTSDGAQCFIMNLGGLVLALRYGDLEGAQCADEASGGTVRVSFRFAVSKDGRWLATFDNPGENGPKAHLQSWDVTTGKALGKPLVAVNGLSGTFFSTAPRLLVGPGRGEGSVLELAVAQKAPSAFARTTMWTVQRLPSRPMRSGSCRGDRIAICGSSILRRGRCRNRGSSTRGFRRC